MRGSLLFTCVVVLAGCSGAPEITPGFGGGDAPTVSLKITDQNDWPVEGARVRAAVGPAFNPAQPLPVLSQSDAEGHAWVWFRDPEKRLVEVHVDADNRAPTSLWLHVDSAPPTVVLGPGVKLEGQVLDESGVGAAGAIVTARPLDPAARAAGAWTERVTQTDADGRFALEALPEQGVHLVVRKDGMAPAVQDVGQDAMGQPVSVTLGSAQPGSGQPVALVVTTEDGEAIPGALVRAEAHWEGASATVFEGTTNESGAVHVVLPAGTTQLIVRADAEEQPATTRTLQGPFGPEPVMVALTPSRKLVGEVVRGDGQPMTGLVQVRPSDTTVPLDADGKFVVEGAALPPDEEVEVGVDWLPEAGVNRSSARVGAVARETVGLSEDEPTEVYLEAGALLPITVTTRTPDGAPVRNVLVKLSGGEEEERMLAWGLTSDAGELRLLVPEGVYEVVAERGGSTAPRWEVVRATQEIDDERTTIDLVVEQGAVLSGTLQGQDGQPLASTRFTVSSERFNDEAVSNADGSFSLQGVAPGTVATITAGDVTMQVEATGGAAATPTEPTPTGEEPLVGSDLPDLEGEEPTEPTPTGPDMGEADPGPATDPGPIAGTEPEPAPTEPEPMPEPTEPEPMPEPMPTEPEPMPEPTAPPPPATGIVEGSVKETGGAAIASGVVRYGQAGAAEPAGEVSIDSAGQFQAPDLAPGGWWFEAAVPRHVTERVEVEVRAGEATPVVLDVTAGSYVSISDYPFGSRSGDVTITLTQVGHEPLTFTWSGPSEAKSPPFGPVWPGENEIVVRNGDDTRRMTGTLNPGRRVLLSWTSRRWR